MSVQVPQFLVKMLLIVIVASLAVVNARPNHFGDANQAAVPEQDNNNLLDSGLKPWQLEMLAQRLSEINSQQQQQQNAIGDFTWERGIRSSESKRQSRYRQCYFNPISCFRK